MDVMVEEHSGDTLGLENKGKANIYKCKYTNTHTHTLTHWSLFPVTVTGLLKSSEFPEVVK